MSKRKINLEEIYEQYEKISRLSEGNTSFIDIKKNRIKAMKEACRQTLELAAENANMVLIEEYENYYKEKYTTKKGSAHLSELDLYYKINKQSILKTINQIE